MLREGGRKNFKKTASLTLALLALPIFVCENFAFADSMIVTSGVALKQATLSKFVAEEELLPVAQLRINRATSGRWSFCTTSTALIDPFTDRKTSLFGLAAGVAYDNKPWLKKETLQDETGYQEIWVMPRWHIRYFGLLGAWWYSDYLVPLKYKAAQFGYPIAGMLVGLESGATVTRFVTREISISASVETVFPIGSFPLRFYMGSIGVGYWYN